MSKLFMECQIKAAGNGEMSFTAYGNVKNIVDKALDVAMDGCYTRSINEHKRKGTNPRLFWGHDSRALPVGKISRLEEDTKGLLFEGKLSKTTMGNDLYVLAMDNAVDSLSIGYNVISEKWNSVKGYNELHDIDVKEISFVNFACNEESLLQDIKSAMAIGNIPSVRELEKLLRDGGLSRKQAMTICSHYKPKTNNIDLIDVKGYSLFN